MRIEANHQMSEKPSAAPPTSAIAIPKDYLRDFCERNHIRRLSLFGSVLTNRFRPESDIDMLVEFETGEAPGYFGLAGMEIELSEKLGRKVDLRTPRELSKHFRAKVVAGAAVQYERP
jgi:predicted nucleotidyltransferase